MLKALSLNIRTWSVNSHCRRGITACLRSLHTETKASNPFPYPTHRNPTPHQLFHLPRNATELDIKARYFDLVRLYHPDKAGASVSPDVAHARFQAITAAYDVLRGKKPPADDPLGYGSSASSAPKYQSTAAYRAMRRKRQELYNSGAVDDSWKDNLILFGVIMTVVAVMLQTATMRREVLSEALSHRQAMQKHVSYQREEERLSLDQSSKPPSAS